MHIRNLVSPIALAAALTLSGGALGQTSIAGMDIPAEDLPEVQALCDSLAAAENQSLTATGDEDGEEDDDTGGDDAGDDDDEGSEPGPNDDGDDGADDGTDTEDENDPASEDGEASDLSNALTTIDLDVVTLADCREAGLVE